MRRAAALTLVIALGGCAESVEVPETAAGPRIVRTPERGDSFWVAERASEAARPPLPRPRSISLGYIGEGKLEGGIGRDDPTPPPHHTGTWAEYVSTPSWPGAREGFATDPRWIEPTYTTFRAHRPHPSY